MGLYPKAADEEGYLWQPESWLGGAFAREALSHCGANTFLQPMIVWEDQSVGKKELEVEYTD